MENFIKLNLHNDSEKADSENLQRPEDNKSVERDRRLNLIANIAAHKAAKEYSRERFGIFSK